ncbi:hypothetical protein QBC35DRAFT_243432 [Podospora australis]|uniref:Uncharacterized protein n=1 Tax=Podospora australis TaxID=1536484 RepID=A0AAN7AMJ2_9PEZI|nr:hypothetical protein QBC35DRAFT_243432 [Podospora australis]
MLFFSFLLILFIYSLMYTRPVNFGFLRTWVFLPLLFRGGLDLEGKGREKAMMIITARFLEQKQTEDLPEIRTKKIGGDERERERERESERARERESERERERERERVSIEQDGCCSTRGSDGWMDGLQLSMLGECKLERHYLLAYIDRSKS